MSISKELSALTWRPFTGALGTFKQITLFSLADHPPPPPSPPPSPLSFAPYHEKRRGWKRREWGVREGGSGLLVAMRSRRLWAGERSRGRRRRSVASREWHQLSQRPPSLASRSMRLASPGGVCSLTALRGALGLCRPLPAQRARALPPAAADTWRAPPSPRQRHLFVRSPSSHGGNDGVPSLTHRAVRRSEEVKRRGGRAGAMAAQLSPHMVAALSGHVAVLFHFACTPLLATVGRGTDVDALDLRGSLQGLLGSMQHTLAGIFGKTKRPARRPE